MAWPDASGPASFLKGSAPHLHDVEDIHLRVVLPTQTWRLHIHQHHLAPCTSHEKPHEPISSAGIIIHNHKARITPFSRLDAMRS